MTSKPLRLSPGSRPRRATRQPEVIFGGDEIPDAAAALIRAAPAEVEPMDVVRLVLDDVAATRFDGKRDQTAAGRRMIKR